MSKQKGNLVRDWPLKKDGSIDIEKLPRDENGMDELDRAGEEAYENGTLTAIDILGNEEPMSKKDDIIIEMLTGEEKPLSVDRVLSVVKYLQGKILTIIDATFTDEQRIKYVKDIIKDAFSSSSQWILEMAIREFEEDVSKPKK